MHTLFCLGYIAYCMRLLIHRCTLIQSQCVCNVQYTPQTYTLSITPLPSLFSNFSSLWCCLYSQKAQFSMPVTWILQHQSSVLLLSTRSHSCRCGICWPSCSTCPGGPAGYDLMVIWSPCHHRPRYSPPFSLSPTLFFSTALGLMWPEESWWCHQCESTGRCCSVQLSLHSQFVTRWEAVPCDHGWSHHICVSLSTGLVCASTSWFYLCGVKRTLLLLSNLFLLNLCLVDV